MAKNVNVKITTEEIKITGILDLDNGFNVETENKIVDLLDELVDFNGADVEISIKKKVEEPII